MYGLLLVLLGSFSLVASERVDFDVSMRSHKYAHVLDNSALSSRLYDGFKLLYKTMQHEHKKSIAPIPYFIHQIWLGDRLPGEYVPLCLSWKTHHPTWHYLFWVDHPERYGADFYCDSFEQVAALLASDLMPGTTIVVDVRNLSFDNKKFYDASSNYGERSDILRWEIIYRLGGLYVDTDFECFKPFDNLHEEFDFYTGLQPLDTGLVQLGAALVAAVPGHPILGKTVEGIKDNQSIVRIISKTGPIHFTRSCCKMAGSTGMRDMVFPATYFYPCEYNQPLDQPALWMMPESYAVHHWAGSWLKPAGKVH